MNRLIDAVFDISLWITDLLWIPERISFHFFVGIALIIFLDIIVLVLVLLLWLIGLVI